MTEAGRWTPPPASHAHVVPRLAATVVLARDARGSGRAPESPRGVPRSAPGMEVLLTRRPSTMAFAADVHVFPGGAVDEDDQDPALRARTTLEPLAAQARLGGDLDPATAVAVHVAALRELAEEAGVVLVDPLPTVAAAREAQAAIAAGSPFADVLELLDARAGRRVRLAADALVPWSRWITPPLLPRRFDARFFAAALPLDVEPVFSADEVVAHRWVTPAAALEAAAEGDIDLWLPTSATLQQLAAVGGSSRLADHPPLGAWLPPRVTDAGPGLARADLHGAGGVPGQPGTAWLVGYRRVVIVDPGDPSPDAVEALIDAVAQRGGRPVGVLVSSADPDRAAGAEPIAMRLDLEILGPPGAARLLPHAVTELPLAVTDLPLGARVPSADRDVRLSPGKRSGVAEVQVDGRLLPRPTERPGSAATRGGCAG